ncbi:YadA-like family protein, partial [Escherichia coli]|nr:YadA-like family protein [Escherichia coli]
GISTDAVNGSQLFATNSALTQSGNNIRDIAVFLGGGATITPNGSFKAPAYQIQGSTRSTLGESLTALDTALTINTQKINMLNDYIIKAPRGMRQEPMSRMIGITATSGETLADLTSHNSSQGDTLMVDNSKNMDNKVVSVGSASGGVLVDFRGTDGERGLTGIADGTVSATSTDAVNGKQLYETNQKVAQNTTEINKLSSGIKDIEDGKVGLVQQASNLSEVTIAKNSGGEKITVSGTDGNRQITGVKEGVNDNDAVTVSQLKEVSGSIGDASMLAVNSEKTMKPKASGKNAIALGSNSRAEKDNAIAVGADVNVTGENSIGIGNKSTVSSKNSVALGSNSVASEDNTVSVGSSLNQRRITNVAPGVNRSDAVTVGQLNESFSSLKQYTDRKVDSLDKKIGDMKTKLTAGIATSMALSGIPQAYQPDSSLVGVSAGTYGGESAIAVGVSHISQNGHWITKLQAGGNTQNDFGASVGVGYQW